MSFKEDQKPAGDNAQFDRYILDPAKLKKETQEDLGIKADPVSGIQSASDHYMHESKKLAQARAVKYLGHSIAIFSDASNKWFFRIDGPKIKTETCRAGSLEDAENKAKTVLDVKTRATP